MEHTSKDLRVRRTLKAIRSAFYELVLTKNYSDISITELTDLAEINRKTFYLHYSSGRSGQRSRAGDRRPHFTKCPHECRADGCCRLCRQFLSLSG